MNWLPIAVGVVVVAIALFGYDLWNRRALGRRYPREGERVTVDGVALHVLVRGEGRPVVLLHGNFGDGTDFSGRLRDQVCRDFKAVIIDRPGYGYSERPPEGLSVIGQAALVREAVQRVGVEHPLLVAHSWSGFLALAYALEHGSELAGVVMLNPLCYADDTTRRTDPRGHAIMRVSETMPPILRPLFGHRAFRASMRARFAPEPVPDTEATDPLLALRRARHGQRHARAEDFAASMRSAAGLAPRYAELTLPLVIVVGDGDRVAAPALQGYRLHNQVHSSFLRVIPDAGHMIHITRPTEVMDAIHVAWEMAHKSESDHRRPSPPKVDAEFIAGN